MRFLAAVFVVATLAAGVSCVHHLPLDVDLLDIDALVAGVHTKENVAWFEENANSPHGLVCTAACRGFGNKSDCKGLHTSTCSGVHAGDKATVFTRMLITCLGAYSFEEKKTDEKLTMGTGCAGLFASHTFTGVTKNTTALTENCHGHCSEEHKGGHHCGKHCHDKGSHCGKHCHDKSSPPKFDAVVKSDSACGLMHTWKLDHPMAAGAPVSMFSTCSGVSSFIMSFYEMDAMPANEDIDAEIERIIASYELADSSTPFERLSAIVDMAPTSTGKVSDVLETAAMDVFANGDDADMEVTCNGKPAKIQDQCKGVHQVDRKGPKKDGGEFQEENTCTGLYMSIEKTLVCEGNMTSDRTDISEDGELKVSNTVCKGKHLFSLLGSGFNTVCVGKGSYDTKTTLPSKDKSPVDEPEDSPKAEAEPPTAAPEPVTPKATPEPVAEAPTTAPEPDTPKAVSEPVAAAPAPAPAQAQESAAKPIWNPIHVPLFKNEGMPVV